MAYKKYIKRNGKIYGPYIYHSKRVDGKVISEYRGPKKIKKDFKRLKLILTIFGMLMVLGILIWLILTRVQLTGNVVLDQDYALVKENPLGGLSLVLYQGELIPAETLVSIKTIEGVSEYNLSGLIDSEISEGNFYMKNFDVSGQGEGIGFPGLSKNPETIFFQYKIISQNSSEAKSLSFKDTEVDFAKGDNSKNSSNNLTEETNKSEETIKDVSEETNKTEEVIEENFSNEMIKETPEETNKTEEVLKRNILNETNEEVPKEAVEEKTSDETINETPEETTKSKETIEETPEEKTAPLTGAIIGGFARNAFRFTGKVIDEKTQADLTATREFKHKLSQGEILEIIPGSIKTEKMELPPEVLKVEYKGDYVIVSTNYSGTTKDFGKSYITSNTKTYNFNIDEKFLKENIELKLIYNGKELTTYYYGAEKVSEESEEEVSLEKNYSVELTPKEIEILKNHFGELKVSTSAKTYRDKILVTFTISDYQIEHYYEAYLTQDQISELIEQDKIRFLKDFAREFAKQDQEKSTLEIFTNSEIIN